MNTDQSTSTKNFKERFGLLMRNKKFKSFLSTLYSLGASVVVLGALFKIQHWPGAGFMLSAGLITEALIFFIYAFEPDEDSEDHSDDKLQLTRGLADSHISNHGADFRITNLNHNSLTQLDKMLDEAAITPDVFFKFGEGMRKLGESTENMNSIVDVSVVSKKYIETIKKADESLEKTAKSYEFIISNVTSKTNLNFKSITNSLSIVESGAREFEQQMNSLNKNLVALNSVYKLQKKGVDDILKEQAEAAAESKIYREQIKELNKNLLALNQLYSNMLSAVKTR
jgi:gliding motility-associated protein GldL